MKAMLSPDPVVNRSFRRLALVTVGLIYVLIAVGAVVRVTESGLGCPDWPTCHGGLVPPPEQTAVIEFAHRLVAGVGGLFIVLTAVIAWRYYRRVRWIAGPALATVALVPAQYLLGAVVVATELEPLAVVVHLGMALLIFASALILAVATHRPITPERVTIPRGYPTLLLVTTVGLFVLLTTGALVAGDEAAAWACAGWPLCNGRLLPSADAPLPVVIQAVHRAFALGVGLLVMAVAVVGLRARRAMGPLASGAVLAGALFVVQATVGATVIFLRLDALWRALHLATASGVWAVLIVLTVSVYFSEANAAVDDADRAGKASGLTHGSRAK